MILFVIPLNDSISTLVPFIYLYSSIVFNRKKCNTIIVACTAFSSLLLNDYDNRDLIEQLDIIETHVMERCAFEPF